MQMIFTRTFCAGHRLMSGKSAKCEMPHGHNWQVQVTIESTDPNAQLDLEVNMIEEFGAAKKVWHNWIDDHVDHSFFFNQRDERLIDLLQELVPHGRFVITPGDPTTEICCAAFMAKCNAFLQAQHGDALECTRVTLIETPTNTVSFDGTPSEWGVPTGTEHWWNRADMSVNDCDALDEDEDEDEEEDTTMIKRGH